MPVSIYEWEKTVTGGDWIEVTSNKVINLILRELNNLIKINGNNEVYVDLQLDDNLQSTSTIPVGVNVWRVLQANGFPVTWTLITAKTTSWDTVKVLYWDDGKIRVDNGTGTWKIIQYEMHAGVGISIDSETHDDYSAMRWPCPEWFHVPTITEAGSFVTALTTLKWDTLLTSDFEYLWIPAAWWRRADDANLQNQWTRILYWCNSLEQVNNYASAITDTAVGNHISTTWWMFEWDGWNIRPFKNTPVVPDWNWTTLYDGSSIATWAWIFQNATLWLVSVSDDWENWITIADKNVGATVVYNNWDTLSQDNCGYYFQWGNNYWFPFTGTIANTSLEFVDVTGVAPSTYSSDTFVRQNGWEFALTPGGYSTRGYDLWGAETWVQQITVDNIINNTWVLSVNWQTWHVTASMAYFKTQEEYDALPASKTSDNNLYIIVDNHIVLKSYAEICALSCADAVLELNTAPEPYWRKFYLEWHIYMGFLSDDGTAARDWPETSPWGFHPSIALVNQIWKEVWPSS